jgi:conjugative relaxase-like TrwC/TraI family protein
VHVVRGSGVDYYLRDLVPGRAEETLVAGESPGRWSGRGCAALGLGGPVEGSGLAEVLAGRDPVDGRELRRTRGNRPVSGFDLTFCAPKSASVLHMLAPAELGGAVGASHEAAVTDAVAYLDRNGLGVRRMRSGEQLYLPATGAVGAGFVHRTSRALDPHLHTHFVTANIAQGVDGSWSALDSRRLFLHRRATEAVYDASLRHHLSAAAGVAWTRAPTGGWAVDGVDPVLCRLFSQRAASIDEHAHRAGHGTSIGARRIAFHADRPDKERGHTVDGLQSGWRRRAGMVGLDLGDLVRVVGRDRELPTPSRVDPVGLETALEHLANTRSRVSGRDLVATVADATPGGLPGGAAERAAAAIGAQLTVVGRDGEGSRSGSWEPAALVAAVRSDPELVIRAVEGHHPSRGFERHEVDRVAGRRLGRSEGFGHAGPDVDRLRR